MGWLLNLGTRKHVSRLALEAVLDNASEGVIVSRAIHDWRGRLVDFEFQFNNQKASEFLDRPSDQILGRRLLTFLDPVQNKACFERYSQVYLSGKDLCSEAVYNIDAVEHWYRVRIKKIDDGVVTFFQDTTLEHHSGIDSTALNGLKESLLQTPSASLWIKNLQGSYTFANRGMRELVGLRFWQIVGKEDEDLFPLEIAKEFQSSDRYVIENRIPQTMLQKFVIAGSMKTVFTQKFPIFGPSGEILAIGGIASETQLVAESH